jgi:small subunit ribosomal protein S16
MLAIRMRRVGSKKRPFFRLVVARSEAARDGSFLEILGSYYPRAKPAKVEVDRERVDYWVSKGARPSDTVRTLIARHLPPPAPATDVTAAAAPAPPVPRPAASTGGAGRRSARE